MNVGMGVVTKEELGYEAEIPFKFNNEIDK
jgi:hypothetical protein